MNKIKFECHFCKVKFNAQIDLNTHLLFTHFFENPECSLDTPHIIEEYFYSKDKFVKCISCNNRYTQAYDYSYFSSHREGKYAYLYKQFSTKQLYNIRLTENYFCDVCQTNIENEEEAKKKDHEQGEKDYYLNRYRRFKKRLDGIWQYLQSINSRKLRMYEKTLHRIHSTNLKLEEVLKYRN